MKTKTILIIAVVVLIAVGVWLHFRNKKDSQSDSVLDKLFDIFKGKPSPKPVADQSAFGSILSLFGAKQPAGQPQFIGDTSNAKTDKDWLRAALGVGDALLDSLSPADASTARNYIENYLRKGVKLQPTDQPMYNDVVRIAAYSNLFNKP